MTIATELFAIDAAAQNVLFREARTANTFTDEPVTDAQVEALYDLVQWAPTLMNSQPMRLVLVRTPESRERLVGHMFGSNADKVASAPLTVIVACDTAFHDHLPVVFPHAPGARDGFADDDRRVRVAFEQTWLQLGYLIVGIRALGLAAGPMAGFDNDGVDADLLAGSQLRSVAVVNIGHPGPDAWFDRNPRLAHHQVVSTM
jgi:3-hydroxypropanoate dehydrogenase